ncbi:hypothetical protein QUF49_14185 [Fictibacillus sp. b24]|uniref:YunG family protein n=1 Tax=Fictibacillus sp. b24 TaxID=3055863 RepID=UPI0025A145F7|nr:hypothetical protein [Fictibacillus sp. b24]MDM5317153.1 hypothetical protein [Fictibacillus sp. b24]
MLLDERIQTIKNHLLKAWSIETSSKWTKENPARGQCGVTALVVQDLLKGDIVKTPLKDGWHFYNLIEGSRYDFTHSQFESPILYENLPSTREEAFCDTNTLQYNHLKQNLIALMIKDGSPI